MQRALYKAVTASLMAATTALFTAYFCLPPYSTKIALVLLLLSKVWTVYRTPTPAFAARTHAPTGKLCSVLALMMIRRSAGAVPPRPTWGARRRRAAMPPCICLVCRRPGCCLKRACLQASATGRHEAILCTSTRATARARGGGTAEDCSVLQYCSSHSQ